MREEYERMLQAREVPTVPASPIDTERVLVSPSRPAKTPPRPPVAAPKVCSSSNMLVLSVLTSLLQTREAQARMEEMMKLINKRPKIPGALSESAVSRAESTRSESPVPTLNSRTMADLASQADSELREVAQNQETLEKGLRILGDLLAQVHSNVDDVRLCAEFSRRRNPQNLSELGPWWNMPGSRGRQ